jgi:SAM-dependent methyltransferase
MNETLAGKKILEVGLGYGTLGEELAGRSGDYYGLDIAEGPAEMMRYRLSNSGFDWRGKVQVGSILDAPYKECSFDYVYSIGCLHHSGNLGGAISEVHRLLKAGGKAIIMLYNKHSFRLLIQVPLIRFLGFLYGKNKGIGGAIRAIYDANIIK